MQITTLQQLNSANLKFGLFPNSNQNAFYTLKSCLLRHFGTLVNYALQEYVTEKRYRDYEICEEGYDYEGICEINCQNCIIKYNANHKQILAVYEFQGNLYHLPVDKAYSYQSPYTIKQGESFAAFLPQCETKITGKKEYQDVPIEDLRVSIETFVVETSEFFLSYMKESLWEKEKFENVKECLRLNHSYLMFKEQYQELVNKMELIWTYDTTPTP